MQGSWGIGVWLPWNGSASPAWLAGLLGERLSQALSVLWRYNPFVFVSTGRLDVVLREKVS